MAQKQLQGSQVDEAALDMSTMDGATLTGVDASKLNSYSVHTGVDGILKLDAALRIPAVDGSLITNLAPSDATTYGFNNGSPTRVVAVAGDTMTGNLNISPIAGDAVLTLRDIDGVSSTYVAMRDSADILRSALLLTSAGEAYFDLRNASGTTITRLQLEDTGHISSSVGAAAPTSASHLTRKDYVDDNFVELAGDTMTGTLVVGNGTSGDAIIVRGTTGNAHYYMQDNTATTIGLLFSLPASNEVKLRVYDKADGTTVLTDLGLDTTGNAFISGATPTLSNHLTRKDYVDDNLLTTGGGTNRRVHTDQQNTDLNDFFTSGLYSVSSTSANNPNGTWGVVFVTTRSTTNPSERVTQLYMGDDDPQLWYRSYSGSVWNAWEHLATEDYVDTTTVALDGTRTMTGQLNISYDPAVNTSSLQIQDTSNGNEIDFYTDLNTGSYNPGVISGDVGFIFRGSVVNTGTMFLGPWSTTVCGIRIDGTTLDINTFGQLKNDTTPVDDDDVTRKDYVDGKTGALNTITIDIGDWDMDVDFSASIVHGISSGSSKIRTVGVSIRSDTSTSVFDFNCDNNSGTTNHQVNWNDTHMTLMRSTSGFFDSTDFDTATLYNRGWITIQYID